MALDQFTCHVCGLVKPIDEVAEPYKEVASKTKDAALMAVCDPCQEKAYSE